MVEEDEGEQETLKVWRKDTTHEILPSKSDLDHQKAIGDAFCSRYLQTSIRALSHALPKPTKHL